MRNILVAVVLLAGMQSVYAQTVATVAAKAARVLGRVATFSADAYVYEYYG